MYIKLKVMATLGVALVASGCTKDEPPSGDPNLSSPEARSAVAKIHEMENGLKTINDCVARFPIVDETLASIGKVMETPERVAALDYMTDRFFSIDLSRLKYATQSRAILAIRWAINEGALGSLVSRFEYGDDYCQWKYGLLLKQLAWERAQIVRTVPKGRVKDLGFTLDPEKKKEYESWWQLHYAGISHYESLMSDIERWFLDDKRKMTETAWIGLKEKIEDCLGRPIRTKAQLRDDFVKCRRIEFTEKEDDYAVPWECSY